MANIEEKLTQEHKAQIIALINIEIERLGTQSAVANKCDVSDAAIDQLRKNKYTAKGDDMWLKVGAALGWKVKIWNVVHDTLDTKMMLKVLRDAKQKSMFMAVANRAGSGKTAACSLFMERNPHNVYYIQCQEWSKTPFFLALLKICGVDPKPGYPATLLLEKLLYFFSNRPGRPLLIIDQANSLKPNVLSFIIHLFNACEDKLGMVMIGTPHLEYMIKRGVAKNYQHYDEIDSRVGRSYISLTGATKSDVYKICAANGFPDDETQSEVWEECEKVHKKVTVGRGNDRREVTVEVVEDMRRLKRIIQKRQLQQADMEIKEAKN